MGATGDGSQDPGVSGVIGDPQFQIVFTAIGLGQTDVFVGVDAALLDAFVISGGDLGLVNNALVNL